jgi:hypothetical protein
MFLPALFGCVAIEMNDYLICERLFLFSQTDIKPELLRKEGLSPSDAISEL